jgi:atrophin-1 interacting protein 3 (BAI1-associated protein 1)
LPNIFSGEYDGNLYGTPRPPKEPLRSPASVHGGSTLGTPGGLIGGSRGPSVGDEEDDPDMSHGSIEGSPLRPGELIPGQHPSSEGKRKRNRSNVEAVNPSETVPSQGVAGDDEHNVGDTYNLEGALNEGPPEDEDHGPDGLGPLPPNWEIATTPDGQVYFIDHNTDTTHWEDPRRVEGQMGEPTESVLALDQLPYGWERVDDPRYGVYYIDHVNR